MTFKTLKVVAKLAPATVIEINSAAIKCFFCIMCCMCIIYIMGWQAVISIQDK